MKYACLILIFLYGRGAYAQLTANAGADKTQCPNIAVVIGGSPSATGGKPPYSYSWQPSSGLSSSSAANPSANVSGWTNYTLTVTDSAGNTATDDMWIHPDDEINYSAGVDTGYCFGQQGGPTLGSSANNNASHHFYWQPGSSLSDTTAANPVATPTTTTTYTLVISNNGACPDKVSYVTITPWIPPVAEAGPDTTIDEGSTITLQGSGGTKPFWFDTYNIKYTNTFHPDVWPIVTTTYHFGTEDIHGCYSRDTVVITVRPGNHLFFYSAFTPNNDGDNDVFYIGNVEKFPDNVLKIYNRYGKVVFTANGYDNSWNGTYLDSPVPTGTYFYTFDDGISQKYHGTVTIMR